MIKCYYDLHIHSNLSPCADELMTIHNIINMSFLKGLDIIAVTDHNSAKNIKPLLEVSKNTELIVIPGIEVETYEGIHMLCYFEDLDYLIKFEKVIYDNLPNILNNENILGQQVLYNSLDEEIGIMERMLLNSTKIKIDDLVDLVHGLNGLIFAAHIDKEANSIVNVLGFIPPNLKIDGVEVAFKNINEIFNYNIIQNSDAHYIDKISERDNYLVLKEKSIKAFFNYFRG